jgi:hypothetical protein
VAATIAQSAYGSHFQGNAVPFYRAITIPSGALHSILLDESWQVEVEIQRFAYGMSIPVKNIMLYLVIQVVSDRLLLALMVDI